MLAGLFFSAGLVAAAPARAGLFGGPSADEVYAQETVREAPGEQEGRDEFYKSGFEF